MNVQYYRDKWNEIHENAAKVQRGFWSHRDFCDWMREVPRQLPCKICRNHAIAYLESNPPEYSHNAFDWAWRFHNAVNARLGKDFYDYNRAARKYGV